MPVRAKFKVTEVRDAGWGESWPGVKNITLLPVGGAVGGESEENKAFYAATPGGDIELCVVNPVAAAQFEVGREYYVDFTPAEQLAMRQITTEEEYREERRRLLSEARTEEATELDRAWSDRLRTPERIPLRRVLLTIAAWSAPAYQLPDGRIIYAPTWGSIRADTLEKIQEDYPHATIRPVGPEDAPDGH